MEIARLRDQFMPRGGHGRSKADVVPRRPRHLR
jgi:hypothetical protein